MIKTPDQIFGDLFEAVQLGGVFKDSKTFVDLIPLFSPEKILTAFKMEKNEEGFDLEKFVWKNFKAQTLAASDFESDTSITLSAHISNLWKHLTREKDETIVGSSLIPLPYPYIVPGGRFKEIYYWDSYFTMLGLAEDGKIDMVENMVKNFAYLIETIGHIPNGNRSYFVSRSQPPFFSLMVNLLSELKGEEILVTYLPFLEKEYEFWMSSDSNRVIQTGEYLLNRYFDNKDFPREESYAEDVELEGVFPQPMLHLRAACESGWDFSSRWLADKNSLEQIRAADILPVDLNCLMHHLEKAICKAYQLSGDKINEQKYLELSNQRARAIKTIFYNNTITAFVDIDKVAGQSSQLTLAMLYPLFFQLATQSQADSVAVIVEEKFLNEGGLPTTLIKSGQQWDAPNGWAPLQWIAVKGLDNYGHQKLAKGIAQRWCHLNEKVFKNSGKMMEKYNVEDLTLDAGGGEYDVQEGFGWSNGVYLAMQAFLKNHD
ncbi:MAG: trehalase family glycosidase [Saprospiraceae bacterium]